MVNAKEITRNDILTKVYLSPNTEKIICSITKGDPLTEELRAELYLILCEMKESTLQKAYKEKYLDYMIVNILRKQYFSKTSPFHRKYRINKPLELQEDFYKTKNDDSIIMNEVNPFTIDVESAECVHEALEKILTKVNSILESKVTFLDREIFKLYYKIGKYNRIDGELRDTKCNKATSSYRKIAAKLAIGTNKFGNQITITAKYSNKSVNKTLNIVKKQLNNYEYEF